MKRTRPPSGSSGTASAPACQAWSIAGAAPLQELFEQPVALVLRQASGRDIARRQELFELVAPSMGALIARLLEPLLRALEPLPARQHGRQDRVVPLFMSWRLPEFVQAREEGFDKLVEAPIVIAVLRPVVGDHDCAARHRLDALAIRDQIWIVFVRQHGGRKIAQHLLVECDRKNAEAVLA